MRRKTFFQKIKTFFIQSEHEYSWLLLSVLGVFVIRYLLSFLPSFSFDMGSWLGWARKLSSVGLSGFYSDNDWTQYTPGYLYWLWVIGKLGWINEMAVKIPVTLADLSLGVVIWSLVRNVSKKMAFASFFIYTLSPVVLFDGPVWGQIDGLLTLFLFLSAYFLIDKKNFSLSVFFWAIAFLIKPQSLAIAPALFMSVLLGWFKFKEVVKGAVVGVLTILLLSWPFFPENPFSGLFLWIIKMGNFYSYTSVFAFNIWSWVGFWRPDTVYFWGLTLAAWGILFFISAVVLSLLVFRKKLNIKSNYYLLFSILSLSFFLFPTKVHERYIFPFFAFLLTSAALKKSVNLFIIFFVTTVASFFNLYYPYTYYNKNFLFSQTLYSFSEATAKLIGFIFLITYFAILLWEKLPKLNLPFSQFLRNQKIAKGEKFLFEMPKVNLSEKTLNLILIAILGFSFLARIFNLGFPKTMYFDEVYHVFTAKEMMHGNSFAWEWWNTPPEGFAYEWTHPPLAKLGMILGMRIFGENAFGWRFVQSLLGVGSVFLVYILAKRLFKDKPLALMAAGVFSLDGLQLVMSRIGMNDSYLLFFVLLTIIAFLKGNDFFSALSFGFAISSKWSAVWVLPILFLLWLRRKNKIHPLTFLYFLTMPIAIYVLSYIPMFLTGHNIGTWWEMQKQMWWYHTGLNATHPYTSSWWSWPLLARPIYLYTTEEVGGLVGRIYAMGSPLIFWFGFTSIIACFIHLLIEKRKFSNLQNRNLGLVVFSYFIFFAPWALSPRIMFLYHYLPSIPFMSIAIAYILRRNLRLIVPFFVSALLIFIYFYAHWTGISIPLWLDKSYYWVNTWR